LARRTAPRRFTLTSLNRGTEGLEHALDPFAVRNLAHGERGIEPAILLAMTTPS